MRCKSCGANLAEGRTSCEFCGSAVEQRAHASGGGQPSRAEVFARIKQKPTWANRNSPARQAALPKMPALATIAPVIFFVIFIGGSGFMAIMMLGMAGLFGFLGFNIGGGFGGGVAIIPAVMALMPIGFVVLGFFMMTKVRQRVSDFKTAPVEAEAAIIVGKRTQVSGGSGDSSASTAYYVTAQFEDGRREEYATMTPTLYGKLSEDDAGVLFIRSTFALDFDRVEV